MRTLAWAERVLRRSGLLIESNLGTHVDDPWFGAAIDTRSDCKGRLFFALKGERTDGHRFAADAIRKGGSAVVIEHADVARTVVQAGAPYFHVNNVLSALQELARGHRKGLDFQVVAITGSAGKTTTKEYVFRVLRTKYRVHPSAGNFNNHIGVPITLLEADEESEYLVSEVGANHKGEIEFLGGLLRPDVGVVTNIGDAHIGLFGSRDDIAAAKAELLDGIDREGTVVLPGDDEYVDFLRGRARCRVVTFGEGEGCTYRVSTVDRDDDAITFRVNDRPFHIRSFGMYNVFNACAAVAVGDVCGVEMERIREALAGAEPVTGRSKVYRSDTVVLVDDSYNANPTSMRLALAALLRWPARRRIAVLGDMAELGSYTESAHRELGAHLARIGIDRVYWLGESGRFVQAGTEVIRSATVFSFHHEMDELIEDLIGEITAGDVVLAKASRVCRLDVVVEAVRARVLGGDS